MIKSISPSALASYEKDPEGYYLRYMADPRPPREPQAVPASAGSAFDAYVKSALIERLTGEKCFVKLFEDQVEPQNREFAFTAGEYIFENYKHCGAYDDLCKLLDGAIEEPRFEFSANAVIDGVPLAGKPDCRFVHKNGAHIILDWKVNGYCGEGATSPSKGYALVRDGLGWDKPSRSHGKSHRLYQEEIFLGLPVNRFFMEQVSIDWADQLSIYAWMLGEPVGSDQMVVCIEQVVGNGRSPGSFPKLRIANHRSRVSAAHQMGLYQRIRFMWDAVNNGQIFMNLSEDENKQKREELNRRARSMLSDGTVEGDFFAHCARAPRVYKAR